MAMTPPVVTKNLATKTIELAIGAAASEVVKLTIGPSSSKIIPVNIPIGSRIAVRATVNASAGSLVLNMIGSI
jgi:hypothetical protein